MENLEINFSITTKSLSEITKDERRRINYLTLKYASLMRDDVLHADEDLDRFQLFFAKHKERIVGWGVTFPGELSTDPYNNDGYGKHYIYTYVQHAFRRKGIGKALVTRASQWAQQNGFEVEVFAWNQLSESFYGACKSNLPIEVVIEYV